MKFKQWFNENEEINLSYLLAGPGQVPQIGSEEAYPAFTQNGSVKYVSPHGSYRYLYFVDGKPVSALQVVSRDGKNANVANVYTLPEYRKKGYATELFERAKQGFKKLTHSKDLSTAGSLWATKVGSKQT
jgi:GNAT superfamily N-acetyltransferase